MDDIKCVCMSTHYEGEEVEPRQKRLDGEKDNTENISALN